MLARVSVSLRFNSEPSTSSVVTATMSEPRLESGSSTTQQSTSFGVASSRASSTATSEIISPPIFTKRLSRPSCQR